MATIPPTYSLADLLASRTAPVRPPAPTTEARASATTDRLDLTSVAASTKASPLVAARVAAPVDFTAPASPMGLYRHPADRNAAATGVSVGARLDVTA